MVWAILGVIVLFAIIVLLSAIKIVQEYERGVVFRLGRLAGVRGPGLILLIPFIERMVKVDLRTVTMDVPAQEVITRDNVTIRVNAVAYFRVMDPQASVVNVADFIRATSQIAQTTLRSILGQSALDDLLGEREKINQQLQVIIDEQTEPWGVKVSVVEVKDVELPQSMQRAMARQAEAEREKRAKIIHAEGEFQASQQLAAAASVIEQSPVTIQLRYLQTLTEIGTEKNTTVVFPVPIELLGGLMGGGASAPRPSAPRRPSTSPAASESPSTPGVVEFDPLPGGHSAAAAGDGSSPGMSTFEPWATSDSPVTEADLPSIEGDVPPPDVEDEP
jgi:regulator of protease activity HflC (stomatin/prohibitin superfamily)